MKTATTEGVNITVRTKYRADLSNVIQNQFFFNYTIEIKNENHFDVKLMYRNWYIFDSINEPKLISGEGVVGEQPILKPGQSFSYTSGCDLLSEIGYMKGFYTFENQITGENLQVFIPTFEMYFPGKLN
ncbi:MAG: Co2+/Mg2+ efflux protein ApaG [Flavobacteriia bacterium]|nr:Co2+/Mg2+ efflux protein ApaG [Flavobacteriia bacterium]